MYLPNEVGPLLNLAADEKIMNYYEPIVPMNRFDFNTGIIGEMDVKPGYGYLLVTNHRLLIVCVELHKPYRLLMDEKLEDIIPEVTKICQNSQNRVVYIQGRLFHIADDAIPVIEMIWAVRRRRMAELEKEKNQPKKADSRVDNRAEMVQAQAPININIGKIGDDSVVVKDSVLQKSNIGGKEAKTFSICPYCGEELNLPKTPKYCPYCREMMLK
jgi:hypothetical protein